MRVISHGGAGTPPEAPQERQATLESDPRFNAGVGGSVQSDGHVRTDAGLMTDDREAGAVCGMPGVEHAVDVARTVKEETPHVLVAGVHAVDLAEAAGVETGVDLQAERTSDRWNDLDARPDGDQLAHAEWVTERFGGDPEEGLDPGTAGDHDTVGAVATDGDRVAAATSTGVPDSSTATKVKWESVVCSRSPVRGDSRKALMRTWTLVRPAS